MVPRVKAGEIDHLRVGRRTYLSRAALTKFIEANTSSGWQPKYAR